MEHGSVLNLLFIILIVAAVVVLMIRQRQNSAAAIRERLIREFGKAPNKKMTPERYAKVPALYLRRKQKEESPARRNCTEETRESFLSSGADSNSGEAITAGCDLDDITWNDLEMDRVYARIDSTQSAAGEEYLYALLRSPAGAADDGLNIPLETIRYFEEDANQQVRVSLQGALRHFGHAGKYSLYEYLDLLDEAPKESNWVHVPCFLLPALSVLLMVYQVQAGLLCLLGSLILNMVTYYRRKGRIEPYLMSFAYLLRMMECADRIQKIDCPPLQREMGRLQELQETFAGFRRHSGMVLSGSSSSNGNPLDFVMDYIRIFFHLDLIRFNSMLKIAEEHHEEMEQELALLGRVDATIALASFEKSLPYTCVPKLHEARMYNSIPSGLLRIQDLYHPLLQNAIPNSIDTEKSVLLTGSNASGKSTFLKGVALCAVMAQTIGFCPAREYEGTYYRIRSSMALRDNLSEGESYFMVEIRSLKRIADLSADGGRPVLCFVDEVLRGTNTVERIAASSEILETLAERGVLCFAATHDMELSRLLASTFDNYHFEEELDENRTASDVVFSYRMQKGPATTRNAIRLLHSVGFEESVTQKAAKRAEQFEQTGIWE